ncbi:uncharacterized protein LOC134723166 [Mytilus trossulus]|uniref:uncharacterized protein LOC134723166 n=1 Tax=Mytilus trossulus TaxID=6551 RepID=UPI003006F94A
MEIQIFADGDFEDEDLENRIEFFYTPITMQCPIDGCNAGRFGSKAKYQRHWDEKHLYLSISYSCPERLCKSVCRRKADMKQHLKKIHEIENVLKLETKLTTCKKEVRENKGFVDPGIFIFRGRTKLATTTTSTTSLTNTVTTMGNINTPSITNTSLTNTVTTMGNINTPSITNTSLTNTVTTMGNINTPSITSSPSITSTPSIITTPSITTSPSFVVNLPSKFPETPRRPPLLPLPDFPIFPDRTPFSLTSRISLTEYRNRSQLETENAYSGHPAHNHSGCTSTIQSKNLTTEKNNQSGCKTTSSETQTLITDLPPLILPLIPETRPEVESLLRWLCNSMDSIGRLRESAKHKLEDIKESGSRQQDRDNRRKLEAENRELRRQIAENKWREELFRDIAKQ